MAEGFSRNHDALGSVLSTTKEKTQRIYIITGCGDTDLSSQNSGAKLRGSEIPAHPEQLSRPLSQSKKFLKELRM